MTKKTIEKQTLFCRDCANHFDEHNKGVSGFILCKCRFDETDHLLNFDYCEKMKLK